MRVLPALVFSLTVSAIGIASEGVALSCDKFQIDNGLTVIAHEDHKAPVVAVSAWYHIGSADELVGKTDFAHLFEHLMFSGSENHKGTYMVPFEKAGAIGMNDTTWLDRTNYFETMPTTALDMALRMESDHTGHPLGPIGQKELDTQRGGVQNEKRQRENRPYGRVDENILKNIFPANHTYHRYTLGARADLDANSLLPDAASQRPMFLYAPVQTDKTAPSMAEVSKEVRAVIGDKPLTGAEISKIKESRARVLPGACQTGSAVLAALDGIVTYSQPDDYVQTLKPQIEAITADAVEHSLKSTVESESIVWAIVGDLKKIEASGML